MGFFGGWAEWFGMVCDKATSCSSTDPLHSYYGQQGTTRIER